MRSLPDWQLNVFFAASSSLCDGGIAQDAHSSGGRRRSDRGSAQWMRRRGGVYASIDSGKSSDRG